MKAKIALEALKGDRPLSEIASEFGVHPNQVTTWKGQLLMNAAAAFGGGAEKSEKDWLAERERMFAKIGQLEYENDWVKKKFGWKD
jgi:transposase-like protein